MQADNINTLVNAAGIKMEPYWANLFSKLFANKNIGDLIANVGAGEMLIALRRRRSLLGPVSSHSPQHLDKQRLALCL